jgi:hypothetical protein
MKQTLSHTEPVYIIHSGIGASNYTQREEGVFELRAQSGARRYPTLLSAYISFIKLAATASIWDLTEAEVLVEAKTYLH